MGLRFEAWTLPTAATFRKRFDIPDALEGSAGIRALSEYSDESLVLPAASKLADEIVTDTTGSWIRVFDGTQVVDEFRADRVDIPEDFPSQRQISGPQRNGLVEGIAIYPKNWPEDKEDAQDWKWGYDSILPDLTLGALGSIREQWEVVLLGERYQLDLFSATGGTFTLTVGGNTTSGIAWDAPASSIKSALEGLSGVNEVSVIATDADARAFWIVFESPKDLASNMTANFGGLTGSGTLTKFNDGFDTSANPTFTITVDGQTTEPMPWNASANHVEGFSATLSPPGRGMQGLPNINDVTVSGTGKFADPWVITFYSPPTIGAFSVTFAAGAHLSTQTVAGALDPSPITVSKPVDAGSSGQHGCYGTPALEVVTTTPLDTGASWTLRVRAECRFAGSQLVLDVNPGQTYSQISVPVHPTVTGEYTLVLRDVYQNFIANTTPRHQLLTAGSYQTLTINEVTIPPGVNQIIMRVAVVDANPSRWATFYTSWETATFFEGGPEATFTQIIRELLDAAHERGTAEFLELDATDAADTNGTSLQPMSFAAFFGGNAHLGQPLKDGQKSGYEWRIVPAADAKVITPTGSHVLQIFDIPNGEIEDLTVGAGGPSVTVGGQLESAQSVRRIPHFTTVLAHGAGALTREDTDATSESNMGRIERVFDAEALGNDAGLAVFNSARFAEEAANRKAASAVVLESDSSRPLVDYTEGSRIWWQFPGNLPKQGRVVRRVAWTHGTETRYQVQGSRVLTGEAAMAKAVDHLLNQLERRRRGAPGLKASDLEAFLGGRGGAPEVIFRPADNPTDKGDIVLDGVNDHLRIQEASDAGAYWIHIMAGTVQFHGRVHLKSNLRLTGAGINQTTIRANTDNVMFFLGEHPLVPPDVIFRNRRLELSFITLDGSGVSPSGVLTEIADLGQLHANNVRFTGFEDGIHFRRPDSANQLVHNCRFDGNGIDIRGNREWGGVISDSIFGGSIFASSTLGVTITGNRVAGSITRTGIIANVTDALVIGNHVDGDVKLDGGGSHSNFIIGNRIGGSLTYEGWATHNVVGGSINDGAHDEISRVNTFARSGELALLSGTHKFVFPTAATLVSVRAAVGSPPVGADLIIDVNRNGPTTIFSTQANRPRVTDGNVVGALATPDVTAMSAGDFLTVDIDQIGSTSPGEDLSVIVEWQDP